MSYTWNWFLNLGNSSVPGSVDREDFCNPTPHDELNSFILCDNESARKAIDSMTEDFDFQFIYFGSVDQTGHNTKFCGPEYIDRISGINENIHSILDAIKNLGIQENTYVILTSDHGARYLQNWHGNQRDDNILIPFYMMGPGIKKNYEIKDYVKNEDVTPTILHMLGYPPNKIWRSRVVGDAFENFVEIKPKRDNFRNSNN